MANAGGGIPLREYINKVYGGSQADFAREEGVTPQQVTKWLSGGWIVKDGGLYSIRRQLKRMENEKYY